MIKRFCSCLTPKTMKAAVFMGKNCIAIDEKPVPEPKVGEALIKITTTTICGTDVRILKGQYPVKEGLIVGHEPIGVIESVGVGVVGFDKGQRVLVSAITPCGTCHSCLDGISSQCGVKHIGGWKFGNTIDGSQAEYILVPDAMTNIMPIPESLTDEQVLLCPDILSTGCMAAEKGHVKIGDTVVVLAQGPIGLCATVGSKLMGASKIITVDSVPGRFDLSKQLGADFTIDFSKSNVVDEVMQLTEGRGADVAIEALGLQATFETALRCIKPGGIVSSLGVYSSDLRIPLDAYVAGLGDHTIVNGLCPGGKERMRRLMSVIQSGRINLQPMITHRFKLDEIEDAYDLLSNQRDGVIKVVITP